MRLGIPRGYFYYEYFSFINQLFQNSGTEIVFGDENNDAILKKGVAATVDEACFPIKLFTGQLYFLEERCDKILIPRIMKDRAGRWLCPKLLGLPELMANVTDSDKYLVTAPINFDEKRTTQQHLWKTCRKIGLKYRQYKEAFDKAYNQLTRTFEGKENKHVEAAWEFMPKISEVGEIILPNTKRILLAGHCYNIYDKFANINIIKKLDELGIGTVTEKEINYRDIEKCVDAENLIKKPFWESFVRIYGTALYFRDKVDGIIYLSSFSCGLDSFIIEMIKNHVTEVPVMVLKLDEHRGEAGFETRLEAFADLLEKRRVS